MLEVGEVGSLSKTDCLFIRNADVYDGSSGRGMESHKVLCGMARGGDWVREDAEWRT
jgi:hypothetical protein